MRRRGIKYFQKLDSVVKNSYECYIAFVIAISGVRHALPNVNTHSEIGKTQTEARTARTDIYVINPKDKWPNRPPSNDAVSLEELLDQVVVFGVDEVRVVFSSYEYDF